MYTSQSLTDRLSLKSHEISLAKTRNFEDIDCRSAIFPPSRTWNYESKPGKILTRERKELETCGFLHRLSREKVLPLKRGRLFNFKPIGARVQVENRRKRVTADPQNRKGGPYPSKMMIFENLVRKLIMNFPSASLSDLLIPR